MLPGYQVKFPDIGISRNNGRRKRIVGSSLSTSMGGWQVCVEGVILRMFPYFQHIGKAEQGLLSSL